MISDTFILMEELLGKLYTSYQREMAYFTQVRMLDAQQFRKTVLPDLQVMQCVSLTDGDSLQGAMFYTLEQRDGKRVCTVPVFGWFAETEKTLSKLFCRLAEAVVSEGSCAFSVHFYAHDAESIRLFSMMQFGMMAEKGIRQIPAENIKGSAEVSIRTLSKQEIRARWPELWALTHAIVTHLQGSPVFYPGTEFTEELYQSFYMDEHTHLHAALTSGGQIIGIIETNEEPDSPALGNERSSNIGEIYVLPAYRQRGIAELLLHYAEAFERQRGAEFLWVEHGTANPSARYFWDRFFLPYEYEMRREIAVF